jgi:hypothetical protein
VPLDWSTDREGYAGFGSCGCSVLSQTLSVSQLPSPNDRYSLPDWCVGAHMTTPGALITAAIVGLGLLITVALLSILARAAASRDHGHR